MEKILKVINNFFYRFYESGYYGIETNSIEVKGRYVKGQYIRIIGSMLNDGVYKVDSVIDNMIMLDAELLDEVFKGNICSLAIPKDLIDLEVKVSEFNAKNKPSAITSESFQGYSYSKATGNNGTPATWQDVFANDLKPYRKMNDSLRNVKEWK